MNTTETPMSIATTDPHDPEWWKDIPKEYKYIARYPDMSYRLFTEMLIAGHVSWIYPFNVKTLSCPKDVCIRENHWSLTRIERPIDYRDCIGKLCFFGSNKIDEVTFIGPYILTQYHPNLPCPFRSEDGDWWEFCVPVTIEQVIKYLYE